MFVKITMAAARVNAGLTQKEFGAMCNVSESTVVKWENGASLPNVKKLPLIEKAYGIPLDYVKIPY